MREMELISRHWAGTFSPLGGVNQDPDYTLFLYSENFLREDSLTQF